MENYPIIKDDIKLEKVIDLIRIHFYIKMVEKKVSLKNFSDRELSILCELYDFGGVFSKEDLINFSKLCFEKSLTESSVQSIRNVLGKARSLGIVKRPKANKWVISNDYLPQLQSKKLIFKYMIHNIDI